MNVKLVILGIIVVAGIVFAVIFATQFAENQQALEAPLPVSSDDITETSEISAGSEELPQSTVITEIETELEELDLSDLDADLGELSTEASGL